LAMKPKLSFGSRTTMTASWWQDISQHLNCYLQNFIQIYILIC
jgi:hypothetical protein